MSSHKVFVMINVMLGTMMTLATGYRFTVHMNIELQMDDDGSLEEIDQTPILHPKLKGQGSIPQGINLESVQMDTTFNPLKMGQKKRLQALNFKKIPSNEENIENDINNDIIVDLTPSADEILDVKMKKNEFSDSIEQPQVLKNNPKNKSHTYNLLARNLKSVDKESTIDRFKKAQKKLPKRLPALLSNPEFNKSTERNIENEIDYDNDYVY